MRKLRYRALFLLALLFSGNTAAEATLLAVNAAQGASGNPYDVPDLVVQDICSPILARRNSGSALFFTILFPWSSLLGFGPPAIAQDTHSESPQGLGLLVVDICTAKRTHNDAALERLLNGLILPNHESWLVDTFGEPMGKRIAITYAAQRDHIPAGVSSQFATFIREGMTHVEIFTNVDRNMHYSFVTNGRRAEYWFEKQRPTRFYFVSFQKFAHAEGSSRRGIRFVYVDGGFRFDPIFEPAPDSAAPAETPVAPAPVTEEPVGGVPGGVVGGVPGGVPGGVVGGVIGELPATRKLPPPKARVQIIRVSGSVMQGKLIHKVDPVYPSIARQARISGVVILEVTVTRNGSIQTTRSLSGHPLLIHAAVEAVNQWKYEPTMLNGETVDVVTTVTINFRLDTKPPE